MDADKSPVTDLITSLKTTTPRRKRKTNLKNSADNCTSEDSEIVTEKEDSREPSKCGHDGASLKDGVEKGEENRKDPCEKCLYCSDHNPQSKVKAKKRFNCTNCGVRRTFTTQEKLDAHIKLMHNVRDPYVMFVCRECCEVPAPVFETKAKYMYHLGSKHPGTIYFVCEICAATFKMKANYRAHMTIHNLPSKKPFSCEVCQGTFVNKAGYESHKRRFPGPHIKHVCEHCKFSFSKESHMKNHRCKKLLLEEAAARASWAMNDGTNTLDNSAPLQTSESQIYHTLPVSVGDPVVIHDLQQSGESEQIIIRDLPSHVVPGNQVLQFNLSEGVDQTHVYHVNVADWNMVAPFVIRDPNAQNVERTSE